MKRVCVDVGGTFTDCLVLDEGGDLRLFKAPTTPKDPTMGFLPVAAGACPCARGRFSDILCGANRPSWGRRV